MRLLVFTLILAVFSGCQQPIKKLPEKKEAAVESESIPEKVQNESKVSLPSAMEKKTSAEGLATLSEFKAAIESGDVPQEKIPEDIKFVSPSEYSSSETKVFENIYFDFDSYQVSEKYQKILKNIASYLKERPDLCLLIEGHCDERGTREYNLVLGEQRALAVRKILIIFGISPKRLYTVSYGLSKPADPGHNEEAWRKNRRCEFKIGVRTK
ncbi:MAG TPA: peptidoglycan-associated lipoprotein Pal [bacterium]|nr:peptidoglycan-associated lipoprotein Pal [bacterium]HOL35260.1 peptidoglycan-associated lipoprotein Pal [bacterium]HPP08719.1 peptidoglycan-associated lipoprotein Pal [bacterium]